MKRNFKRPLAAVLTAVSLLFCSGMTASALGGLGDIFTDIQDKLGNVFSVTVDTELYSNNDFDRTVTFAASVDSVDENQFFAGLDSRLDALDVLDNCYLYDSDAKGDQGESLYIFSLSHASQEQMSAFTEALFPGSAIKVEADESLIGPFCDSYQISETLDISSLCRDMDAKGKLFCNYSGFSAVIEDGGGKADDTILAYSDHTYSKGEETASFAFSKAMTYEVEQISVATDISSTNVISVAVALDFADTESGYAVGGSACSHFIDYVEKHENSPYHHPKLRIEKHEGMAAAAVDGSTTEPDYRLVLRTEGNAESVSSVLTSVFGQGNSLSMSAGKVNSSNILFDRNSIVHKVDLNQLCADAGYEPTAVNYSFSGSSASKLLSMTIGTSSVDVNENKAVGSAEGAVFKAVVDFEAIDISAVIIAVLIGAVALCLVAFILKLFRRRSGKKRKVKSDDIRYEAVKSVALALVPEQERANCTTLEVPSELLNRPTIVIKPKSDDGLDDDDDDPEGVILFSMMLRILLMVQLVLFFFPYFNVSRNNLLNSVDTVTGLDLFLGFKVGDVLIEPDRFAIILFVLPLIMLLCLMARRALPKLALPVAISAGSVFSIFYLLNLNSTIYDRLSPAIEAAASTGSFVSQPASQTGYDYTLVIYMALAIGGIVLLFSNIMAGIALRRQKREEEMRRFEK